MALYYNGIMVSGINFTPRLTLAEYNALEVKPDYWIRTDAESNNITASDIDCTSSGGTTTDVQTELNNKVDKETGKGLFSGSYTDLTDKPTIPSKVSELDNDSGFVTTDKNVRQVNIGTSSNSYFGFVIAGHADDTERTEYVYKTRKILIRPNDSRINTYGHIYVDRQDGTASAVGESAIVLGNSTASGTAGNSRGRLYLYGDTARYVQLETDTLSSNRIIKFPNGAGTLALTSNIPTSSRTSTTHGVLFAYGNIRIFQVRLSAASFTVPGFYSWSGEIPSGSRPAIDVNLIGTLMDSNAIYKGDVNGDVKTTGEVQFEVSNGSTGSYYMRATAMWTV